MAKFIASESSTAESSPRCSQGVHKHISTSQQRSETECVAEPSRYVRRPLVKKNASHGVGED